MFVVVWFCQLMKEIPICTFKQCQAVIRKRPSSPVFLLGLKRQPTRFEETRFAISSKISYYALGGTGRCRYSEILCSYAV